MTHARIGYLVALVVAVVVLLGSMVAVAAWSRPTDRSDRQVTDVRSPGERGPGGRGPMMGHWDQRNPRPVPSATG